ncbi:MAG: bifunctional DNA primase/polymerase, partial [Planctomycetota bacterium]
MSVWAPNGAGCSCRKGSRCDAPGKHPRPPRGINAATTDPRVLQRWKWTSANVGIATGATSGIVVIDIDPRHDGQASLQAAQKRLGALPECPMMATGGGGWHLVFRHPGRAVPSRIGLADGIDIRADGGLVVAPPSLHVSGKRYSWQVSPEKIAPPELPEKWLEWILGACYTGHTPRLVVTQGPATASRAPTRLSFQAGSGAQGDSQLCGQATRRRRVYCQAVAWSRRPESRHTQSGYHRLFGALNLRTAAYLPVSDRQLLGEALKRAGIDAGVVAFVFLAAFPYLIRWNGLTVWAYPLAVGAAVLQGIISSALCLLIVACLPRKPWIGLVVFLVGLVMIAGGAAGLLCAGFRVQPVHDAVIWAAIVLPPTGWILGAFYWGVL